MIILPRSEKVFLLQKELFLPRKCFSLAKRAEALNFSFEKYRSYRETNQFLLKVIIGNVDVRRLLFMPLSKLQTSIF